MIKGRIVGGWLSMRISLEETARKNFPIRGEMST